MRILVRVVLCAIAAHSAIAFSAEPGLGAVAKHQALIDVGTDLRLMCVAAHPDDEDGATLAMYRKKFGYKTFAVLATRGEGGQNEIGPELYEELAVLRTDEMSRASAITGAELHFLDLPEFGYSKSRDETFEIWGHDNALERMVRTIRELRPDVIITHHGPTGGHGHHEAIGLVLQEAFDIAADPNRFPQHMKEGLQPWQPARLYLRNFGGGEGARIGFNELDPFRGVTYAQIAAQALGEHKTQGMQFFIDRFLNSRSTASYGVVKEAKGGTQGGGDVPAPGGALFEGLTDRVSAEARAISTADLESVDVLKAVALVKYAGAKDAGAAARANRLVTALAEVRVTAKADDAEVIPGQEVSINVEAIDFGARDASNVSFEVRTQPWFSAAAVEPVSRSFSDDGFATAPFKITVPSNQPRTQPHAEFVYDPRFMKPQVIVTATAAISGVPVTVEAPVYFEVAPAVSVEFLESPYLVFGDDKAVEFSMLVTNHAPAAAKASVTLSGDGLTLDTSEIELNFARQGDQKVIPVRASAESLDSLSRDFTLTAQVEGSDYSKTCLVRQVDLMVPSGKHIGIIQSYDDTLQISLDRLGVPFELVGVADITPEHLAKFTTVLVDIRAYLDRPDLVANNQTLLDYVKNGGTAIVFYHKTFEWEASYAPYPITIGRDRVTVEKAPIEILQPEHPLFNTPNKIGAGDWDNWIQERGLYFPSNWADEYTPLIAVTDPGETTPPGSCLVTKYGEGTYMYTALVWYRQLRALNPGALRIFANMLAL
jgi:LmbE family N-acetylglucosaminyl deacetylase